MEWLALVPLVGLAMQAIRGLWSIRSRRKDKRATERAAIRTAYDHAVSVCRSMAEVASASTSFLCRGTVAGLRDVDAPRRFDLLMSLREARRVGTTEMLQLIDEFDGLRLQFGEALYGVNGSGRQWDLLPDIEADILNAVARIEDQVAREVPRLAAETASGRSRLVGAAHS